MARPISEYTRKRNFEITLEPSEEKHRSKRTGHALRFVIQKHAARKLHYDFRLEMNGTLKSWAIPKGPSLDPKDKRLAVHVEDHPISYAKFEGSIPKGQYGGGDVIIWDEGIWQPHDDMNAAYKSGKLKFTLIGEKLGGDWALVKTRLPGGGDKEQWLLIKEKDDIARPSEEYDIVQMRPESVITGDLLPIDRDTSAKPVKLGSEKSSRKTATKKMDAITNASSNPAPEPKSTSTSKKSGSIPESFSPELATLVSEPPAGDWLYEIKFDGYRVLARVMGGKVNIFTRNGNDWTDRLPLQAKAIAALKLKDSWLDGEVVVLNDDGLPNFQVLQNAFDSRRSQDSEVEFAEWTSEGVLRQASFISLRTDKPAKDIIRERPRTLNNKQLAAKSSRNNRSSVAQSGKSIQIQNNRAELAGVSISNPDRIIDPESNSTKLDLAAFYENIADFILPQLKNRPVALLRAPGGINGEQFFQKHSDNRVIPNITQLDTKLDPEHAPLMAIANISALIGCVQMNTIELHIWGSTTANIELPDRFILDLDPDPALPWRSVVEAARLVLAALDELKLNAFLKTTGGKGMHILVPLTPEADWVTVKAFSKAIAEFMAKQIPSRFVAKMGPKNRIGKIFVDYLRNTRGASTVAAYSVRARSGLPISVPIAREELDRITQPDQWNIGNLQERLEKLKRNPWGTYSGEKNKSSQKITKVMWKKLGIETI